MSLTGDPFVIVGAGQAAASAARALRKRGYAGVITMIGAEAHAPYERPPLSKAVLHGDEEPALAVLPPAEFDSARIDFRAGVRVRELDTARRALTLDDGSVLTYARCLVATGGSARALPQLPAGGARVHYLRTLDDARRLRASLRAGSRLAIVGGGFLGLEAAHSAARRGVQVTVVESAPALLCRFVVPELSSWLLDRLRALGTDVRLGVGLRDARADPAGAGLVLDDGATIEADEVLVSIGLVPDTALARAAGLALDAGNGGIVVGPDGRTSDPHVFAAGDCASQFRTHLDVTSRLESWQNANEQAEAAAAGMLDQPLPAPSYPWFWTDQGDQNLQMLGMATAGLHYLRRGSAAAGKAVWIGHRAGVPVHGIALNAGGDLRALRPLFEQRVPIDGAAFEADATSLRPWVKALLAARVPSS